MASCLAMTVRKDGFLKIVNSVLIPVRLYAFLCETLCTTLSTKLIVSKATENRDCD